MVSIYTLSDPRNGQVRYVGKTIRTLKERYDNHLSPSQLTKKTKKASWIKSLRSLNLKPTIDLLSVVDDSEWEFEEKFWICQMKAWGFNLTNLSQGGQAVFGDGYNPDQETVKKSTYFRIGRKFTQERIEKIRQKALGRPISSEAKDKIRESLKKYPPTYWNIKGLNIQADLSKKKIGKFDENWSLIKSYPSLTEASKEINVTTSYLSKVARLNAIGKKRKAKNFYYKYI